MHLHRALAIDLILVAIFHLISLIVIGLVLEHQVEQQFVLARVLLFFAWSTAHLGAGLLLRVAWLPDHDLALRLQVALRSHSCSRLISEGGKVCIQLTILHVNTQAELAARAFLERLSRERFHDIDNVPRQMSPSVALRHAVLVGILQIEADEVLSVLSPFRPRRVIVAYLLLARGLVLDDVGVVHQVGLVQVGVARVAWVNEGFGIALHLALACGDLSTLDVGGGHGALLEGLRVRSLEDNLHHAGLVGHTRRGAARAFARCEVDSGLGHEHFEFIDF